MRGVLDGGGQVTPITCACGCPVIVPATLVYATDACYVLAQSAPVRPASIPRPAWYITSDGRTLYGNLDVRA